MGVVQKKKSGFLNDEMRGNTIASVDSLLIFKLKKELLESLGGHQRYQLRGWEPVKRKWSCKRAHCISTVGIALRLMMWAEGRR